MKVNEIDPLEHRDGQHGVDPLFVKRWSPRAMSGEAVSEGALMRLFEAARWSPSSYNNQHWRFVYALRGTADWDRFFDLLAEGNQGWANDAGALVVMISKTTFDHNGKPANTHSFDTGAAWMALALQGTISGLVVHGMQGFDYAAARELLEVPEGYEVEAMCAVGHPGDPQDLPEGFQGERPNGRKPLSEIVFAGKLDVEAADGDD